ncbi:MAG: hypothetical protein ACREAA_10985 [Candidatus Polarisedimenticolia bacterium]
MVPRIFLLSPARCDGRRAGQLMNDESRLELSRRLRGRKGAPLGELFSFMSGLYFRGKLAYARAFAAPPDPSLPGVLVITPHRGLLPWDQPTRLATLRAFACVPVDPGEPRYTAPLRRAAKALARRAGAPCEFVLLGSVATGKYVELLEDALDGRLRFPGEFVGRGDMSRGGLMLRCVREGRELTYVRAADVARRGPRPPKLIPAAREARTFRSPP